MSAKSPPALQLIPQPLTADSFAPYGDVIECIEHAQGLDSNPMNNGAFERFDDLANVNVEPSDEQPPRISIARCKTATSLPHSFNLVERHPLGSQAFIPRARFEFLVVVGKATQAIAPEHMMAFITNGQQGISYFRGTWHMPLIAQEPGQEFIIVDRGVDGGNCDIVEFDRTITLNPPTQSNDSE